MSEEDRLVAQAQEWKGKAGQQSLIDFSKQKFCMYLILVKQLVLYDQYFARFFRVCI